MSSVKRIIGFSIFVCVATVVAFSAYGFVEGLEDAGVEHLLQVAEQEITAGNFEQAIKHVDQAIDMAPGYARSYTLKSIVYAKKGNLADAISSIDKALAIKPSNDIYHQMKGMYLMQSRDLAGAEKSFDEAISLNGTNAKYYFVRGSVRELLGKSDEAKKDLTKAMKLDPSVIREANQRLKNLKTSKPQN